VESRIIIRERGVELARGNLEDILSLLDMDLTKSKTGILKSTGFFSKSYFCPKCERPEGDAVVVYQKRINPKIAGNDFEMSYDEKVYFKCICGTVYESKLGNIKIFGGSGLD